MSIGAGGNPSTLWPPGLVALISGEEDTWVTRLPRAGPGATGHRAKKATEASKGKVGPFLGKSFSLF